MLFADDPFDPDPVARGASFLAAMRARGITALLLDRPATLHGHGAARDPLFDPLFGARLAGFLDGSGPVTAQDRS